MHNLIIGYGNPSRGDDALGPELLHLLERDRDDGLIATPFDTVTDFQLQIEHALDLQGRGLVLFIDASVTATPPFDFIRLEPQRDESYTSHAVSPAAVLSVYEQVVEAPLPPAFLLALPGNSFELGDTISGESMHHLQQARQFVRRLLNNQDPLIWSRLADEREV